MSTHNHSRDAYRTESGWTARCCHGDRVCNARTRRESEAAARELCGMHRVETLAASIRDCLREHEKGDGMSLIMAREAARNLVSFMKEALSAPRRHGTAWADAYALEGRTALLRVDDVADVAEVDAALARAWAAPGNETDELEAAFSLEVTL